jgi:hypothetical protein
VITREQLVDLREGDVVERAYDVAPDTVTRGPLRAYPDGSLRLAEELIRHSDGRFWNGHLRLLTVVSRAPRPLYVNHPRTEPVPGDVVRDADSESAAVWMYGDPADDAGECWAQAAEPFWTTRGHLPAHLRLLVDGTTGQVVQ